ncbi:Acl4p KNAG_0A05030 [Huiozyma naganishii CBS 8797]|uniref:Uncharacterized protein n=1 Tax=Huiozyma naganishii (strain ATCC MYA-139 / BCRC 22969 / CBS 8797 / KCTC 17520 / NBRC 10181 / NCYC 3082 / Yp74L-3) TaxID=1071383 RepID=J7S3T2_HUIN7|nr:hypothetical protein KNAG_0A05030 [Kazachstania naganishii CBS 8797]CCK68171.1 hypothetical protein KNAG_0A05030 [Kazachstania naganishii CBS 8797]
MSDLERHITQAREALAENNAKKALTILKPYRKSLKNHESSNLPLLQIFSEVYLENGDLEKAYPLLYRSCELDDKGTKGGCDKFFTLGQIIGGQDGLAVLSQGIENVFGIAGESISQEQTEKIVSGLLSMIEIWMTDLCMEPSAESQCEDLIKKAMEISENSSAETWSVLGSIRISQQRFAEACEAFTQSWNYFKLRKDKIGQDTANNTTKTSHLDYVDMLQPLLALAKMCIEVGLYEIALHVENAVKEIDEDNLESYYLEGFTNYLIAKSEIFKTDNPEAELTPEAFYEFNQHIQDVPLDFNNPNIAEQLQDAKVALSFASKLGENVDDGDELAQELVSGARALLEELGGSLSDEELQKLRKGDPNDDLGDEIDVEEFSEEN